jgi:hypothetical protein
MEQITNALIQIIAMYGVYAGFWFYVVNLFGYYNAIEHKRRHGSTVPRMRNPPPPPKKNN